MRPGYINHFRYYAGSSVPERSNYTASGWFNLIKAQLNVNRPMTYGIPGHAIVCDGWQEVGAVKQYHMNWGWESTSRDTWYTLDEFPDPPMEHLLANNFPETAIGGTIVTGTYVKNPFPYRYLDQDAYAGFSTTFASGNILQFLHGIRMKANGYIRVESTPTENTRLFSRGDQGHGIRLMGATMELYSSGSVKLY
jgi:hypothetical protein